MRICDNCDERDQAKKGMLKENQKSKFDVSKSFDKEIDPLTFESKLYRMNGLSKNNNPSKLELNDRDDFSMHNESKSRDSLQREKQNLLLCQPSNLREHAIDLSSSDPIAKDSNRECLMAIEVLKNGSEGEYRDSRLPYVAPSDSLETENNLHNQKDVLECELPELEVCCKEIQYHIVKDICFDEGMPVQRSVLHESTKDDQYDHFFPKPCTSDGHYEAAEGDGGVKVVPSDSVDFKVMPPTSQISSRKAVSEGPAASSAEAGPEEDMQASNLRYNNKVGSGSISFDFNTSTPLAATVTNRRNENIKDLSVESVDDRTETNKEASNVGKVHEPFLNMKNGFSNGLSATGNAQSFSSKNTIDQNVLNQSHGNRNENSDCFSSHHHLQSSSSRSINSINSDHQASELHLSKHEHRASGNFSAVSQGKYDAGESSFSAASFIAYSGPIAFSGSLSLRSDSSAATSGRSFAFPILQPEWTTSPVRMSKTDGHFRKHKGWKAGLLCCRF